jgi:hypothetical protein
MLAGPVVAVTGAAALHARPARVYWMICCVLTCMIAAPFYYLVTAHQGPPFNAPIALAAVVVVAPTLATFAVERLWFALGWAVSRPWVTAVLSLPLALLVYVISLFIAVVIGVNVGIVTP